MVDVAIWLLRWTIAGGALGAIVLAVAHILDRSGRATGLGLYRVALIAALIAPIIAIAPPVLTFPTAPPVPVEPYRPPSRTGMAPRVEAPAAAHPDADQRNDGVGRGGVHGGGGASEFLPEFLAVVLILVWAAGAAFAAIRRQRSAFGLSRAFRDGAPCLTSFAECRLSSATRAPLVFGVLRPRMLAPEDFPAWPQAERDAVLRHEAAHVRRGDLVWAAIGDVVTILYWWMPPITALTRLHILATEEACDLASLGAGDDRHEYARALLAITRRVGRHATPGLAATGRSLRLRVERLIAPQRTFAFAAPIAAFCAGLSMAITSAGPAAAQVGHFQIFIFIAAGGTADTYVLGDGERATAATIRSCAGRRTPNARQIIDRLNARIGNGEQDELNPVTIAGPGTKLDLGACEPASTRDVAGEDTLVVVVDASESQARRLIGQIHGLPREDQRQMLAELGLTDRR